jgi:hypothetical protein
MVGYAYVRQFTSVLIRPRSTHMTNDATYTMFYLARPAPAKTSQKLHLRPKLMIQVQRVSYNAHAMPVLELWRPGVFNYAIAKNSIPEAHLRMDDIYVYKCADYLLLDLDIVGHERHVLAVIRKCKSRHKGNGSIIKFRGDHLVTVRRSIEGHYQCTWEDAKKGLIKIKACIPDRDESEGSCPVISDSTGEEITLGRVEGRVISLYQQKDCQASEDGLHSSLAVAILHVFTALVYMDRADAW